MGGIIGVRRYDARLTTSVLSTKVFVYMFGCRAPTVSDAVGAGTTVPMYTEVSALGVLLAPSSLFLPVSGSGCHYATFSVRLLEGPGVTAAPPAALCVPWSIAPGLSGAAQLMGGIAGVVEDVQGWEDGMFFTVHLLLSSI